MGIDVGGTKILLQTFDKKMRVTDEEWILTQTKKGERGFTEQLLALIERHITKSIKVIGIAVPGIVHREKGLLAYAPHIPTKKDYPLKKILKERFNKPVYVDNDINAFLWAEKERPVLKKHKNIVALMIGTGLGGAILNDGKLIYGTSGYAGEVGHMIIRQDGPLKTFEQNVSGCYLPKIARSLKSGGKDLENPKVKRYVLEHLGVGLSNLNIIFNPEAFLLGGSVYRHHLSKDNKKLERMISRHSLDGKSPKIILASSKTSVALGIAMMAAGK